MTAVVAQLFNGKPKATVFQKAVAFGLPLNDFSATRFAEHQPTVAMSS
ncbi:hypothetical protein [Candidatus Laterigemmans baculatus]|nr:hypothetical protein [Candidatus Laterigemmans baculatus]